MLLLGGTIAFAQAPSEPFPPAASVKQLMLDLIHPSSNDILLAIYRGGPEPMTREWAAVRRSAVTLAESGNMLDDAGPRAGSGGLDEGREIAGGRRKRRVQGRAGQRRATRSRRSPEPWTLPAPRVTSSTGRTCFHEGRRVEMSYSRRNFLKAAGSRRRAHRRERGSADCGPHGSCGLSDAVRQRKGCRSSSTARRMPPNTKHAPPCGK